MAEIEHDFYPLLRVYKDGRIERLMGQGVVPDEPDPATGVQIKDVQIDPKLNLSARLYLPNNLNPCQKIPLLVYFHGGAFVIESASSPSYQKHLITLANEANVIIVSVNYRLAPEYPLPTAYEDSWLALKWVADGPDPWLNDHADLNHVHFGGDSAGANIAHHMAIRVGLEKLDGFKLNGIFLACPFFWGSDLLDGEAENMYAKSFIHKLWVFVAPNSSGLDDPLINPAKDPNLSSLGCDKVLVYVAGKDPLRYRGFYYKESLEKVGWQGKLEFVEIKDEEHVFHLFTPTSENSVSMVKKLAAFLNQSKD